MMKISNSNRNSKTGRVSHSNKGLRVKVIVIVVVRMSTKNNRDSNSNSNSIRRHSFWYCGARNAVSTLAAALSAHEYCRFQHLCVDVFLDVRLSFCFFSMLVCCFLMFVH